MPADHKQQAYELAQSLPHFDRDLTAYYLNQPATPGSPEYELHVAHSIMRLHAPPTPQAVLGHLATWRHQGLLHVLSVAALNMPVLEDWFPGETGTPDSVPYKKDLASFCVCLNALDKNPRDYSQTIQRFIDSQDLASATAQAIAATLDRLAILMSVKSNSQDEAGHDLASALQAFPHLDTLEPQDLWARIKPSLERALPPSVLQLDPASARKRAKHAAGTW